MLFRSQRHYLKAENLEDYRVFTGALIESGYNGEISIEAFAGNIKDELAETLKIIRTLIAG